MTSELKSDSFPEEHQSPTADEKKSDYGSIGMALTLSLLNADALITLLDFCDVFDLANCSICGIKLIEDMLTPNSLTWKRVRDNRADYDVFFGQRRGMRLSAMEHCLKVRRRVHAYGFATICERSLYEVWKKSNGKQEISVIVTGTRNSGVTSVAECLRYGRTLGLVEREKIGTGSELRLLWRFVMFRSEKNENFPFQIKYKEIRGDLRASPFAFRTYEGRCSLVAVFSVADRFALQNLGEQFNYRIKTTKMKKGLFESLPKVIVANKCDLPKSEHVISKTNAEKFAVHYNATLIWASALTGWNMNAVNIHALGPQYNSLLEKSRHGLPL